jgi:hypothetical protein
MSNSRTSDRRWSVIIVVYLCLIYPPWILFNAVSGIDFIKGDSHYYRAVIVSLLEDGDLLLRNNIEATDPLNGQLAVGKNGLVPKHPIFMSLVSIPFYKVLGDRGLLLFNVIDCVILILLIFKLNRLFVNGLLACLTSVLYATATLLYNYVYNYSPDVFATVLIFAGLNLVLRKKYYSGALFLGLSVFAKLPNAVLAGVALLYASWMILTERPDETHAAWHKNWLQLACALAFFVIALVPFGYINYVLFGSPVITGYQRTAEHGAVAGEIQITDHVNKFNQPFFTGALRLLLDPNSGILPTNPVLIFAFFGLLHLPKNAHRHSIYLIIALCVAQFLTFAKYDDWQTSEFSNRFLMTFVAGSSVLASFYLKYIGERFFPQTLGNEHTAIQNQ